MLNGLFDNALLPRRKTFHITILQSKTEGPCNFCIALLLRKLVQEGEALHHCVGRMNYDQKMVREETLIFFIRSKERPTIPLVTIEYSIAKRQILQCYADHNSAPSKDIMAYIQRKWLPYANKQLKKLTA